MQKQKTFNCIILASGNGSNAVNLVNHFLLDSKKPRNIKISAVVSNIETAPVIQKIKNLSPSLPVIVIPFHNISQRPGFENELEEVIKKYKVDLIILAGFMKVLSEEFVSGYPMKIINIHPSLLPSFKGKDAIKKAFEFGVKYTGVTVHYVTPEVDSGPIIYQEAVKIEKDDDIGSLESKIHSIEHKIYPIAIKYVVTND